MPEEKKIDTGEIVNQKINDVLKEHGYKIDYQVSFPIYKILPDEVQLALKIITKHGMKISMVVTPK